MKIGQVSLSVFLLIITIDIFDTAANLLLKKGGWHFNVPYLSLGIAFYAINFILWMKVLTKVDLSMALPMASASYILVPIISVIFLHEQVGFIRWMAILLIIVGIYFISKSQIDEEGKNIV